MIGSILGIFGAYLFALVIRNSLADSALRSFLQIMVMLLMAYVGLIVGANKGDLLNLAALGGIFGGEKQLKKSYKILDTSVIIDGRIADIAETGFLDGIVVTPQFVLRELQLVADSGDSLKRNRGRRGLDILQRLAVRLERRARWARAVGAASVARGFADAMREELDFRVEARNTRIPLGEPSP